MRKMDKEVLIHVRGLQMMDADGDQEPIEIVVPGEYYFRNGSHYLPGQTSILSEKNKRTEEVKEIKEIKEREKCGKIREESKRSEKKVSDERKMLSRKDK